jgi:hypothetical protein
MQHSATASDFADGLSWDRVLRRYAETLRTTLLGHPGVLPLFFTRPAVTPQTLKAVEDGLRVLTEAGFALPRALDMINVLSIFVVGHAMAEAGTAELSRRGDPGSAAALAQLDVSDLPLVIEAPRLARDARSSSADIRRAHCLGRRSACRNRPKADPVSRSVLYESQCGGRSRFRRSSSSGSGCSLQPMSVSAGLRTGSTGVSSGSGGLTLAGWSDAGSGGIINSSPNKVTGVLAG